MGDNISNYNTEIQTYINYMNDVANNKGIQQNLLDTIKEERKEYMLLIMWLIITIFVFSITIITFISEKELNPILKYIITGMVLLLCFYLIIYIYNIISKHI